MARRTLAAASADGPPLHELSPTDTRQVLRDVQASVPVEPQPAEIDDRVIPGGPTGQVSIRIVKPAGATGLLPLVFHSHGGGWILGDKPPTSGSTASLPTPPRSAPTPPGSRWSATASAAT